MSEITQEAIETIAQLYHNFGYGHCASWASNHGLITRIFQRNSCKNCGVDTFIIEIHDDAGQVDIEVTSNATN